MSPTIEQIADTVGIKLEPFQRRILKAAAGPEREKLFLLPRGSGKTTVCALDAVHHFVTVPDARVYIAASSEQQANLLFTAALGFARELDDGHLVPRYNHLRWCPDPSNAKYWTRTLEVRAADWRKLHGLTYTRAYLDEMQVVDERVYEAMASGLHKRPDATLVIISTAGQGADSALGKLRARAFSQPDVRHRGVVTDARGPGLRMMEWSLPADANVDDARVVKKANPASWITVQQLAEQRERLPDLAYRRFICNQWTDASASWLPAGVWQACVGEPQFEDGERIWVGLHVDRTGSAVVWLNETGHVGCWASDVDDGGLAARDVVLSLAEDYRIVECALDPYRCRAIVVELGRELPVTEVPGTDARQIPSSGLLRDAIVEKRLTLPDDERLRVAGARAVAKHVRRGWRLDGDGIGPLLALMLAVDAASAAERSEPLQVLGFF